MTDYSKEHLVIVRSYGEIINLNTYNCQEIGLAKALVKKRNECYLFNAR